MRDDAWKSQASAAMERYADGDGGAFETLYDLLGVRMHAFLLRRTRDPAKVEDSMQETFSRMHACRRQFAPGTQVVAWAFAIARNLLIDAHRKDRALPELGTAEPETPDTIVARQRLGRRMCEELAHLPPAHREAFELVRFDGLSMSEAAQVLGTTVPAVKLRAHRAYEALRERLGDEVRQELGGPE